MIPPPTNSTVGAESSCFDWVLQIDKRWTRKIYLITNSKRRKLLTRFANIFMKILEYSCHGVPWLIWTFYHIYFSIWGGDDQAFYVNFLAGLLLDLIVVGLLKVIFRRPRPSYNVDDMYGSVAIDKHAFPSGHATRAILLSCIYWTVYTSFNFRVLLLFWCYWVCLSRILLGRHHLGDVVLGVAVGGGVAFVLFHIIWVTPETLTQWINYLSGNSGEGQPS